LENIKFSLISLLHFFVLVVHLQQSITRNSLTQRLSLWIPQYGFIVEKLANGEKQAMAG